MEMNLRKLLKNSLAEPIVAYDTSEKALTFKQYNKEIDKEINDFNTGRFLSQEYLEKIRLLV